MIELHLDNFKGDFLNIWIFFAPSDSRYSSCISAKYCPIITNHTSMESSFIQYKSQFQKIDPYDWFCGPGSHMYLLLINQYLIV